MSNNLETTDVLESLTTDDKFPEIPRQLDAMVTLQRGLINPVTGEWEQTAEVRELTGYDEERIASLENRKGLTYIEYFTEVLRLGVISIGNIEFKDRLNELTIGDRNILFLAIVRTTYGRVRTFERTCTECKEVNKVSIDLYDDFPLQTPDFDPIGTIKVTLKDGTIHELRPPTAEDNIAIGKKDLNGPAQTSTMIARCSLWRHNPPVNADEWAKSLSMYDRNNLVRALTDLKLGPKLEEVSATCAHCGADMPVLIDWIFLILG